MKRCFLYPGQGAQFPGMGQDLYDFSAAARDLFSQASDAAGFDVAKLTFTGSEDELKSTDKSQVAITTVNLCARAILAETGIISDGAAGFSLGEYSALVDAGILAEKDALFLVANRGRIMEEVSRSLDAPSGSPGMSAIVGLHPDVVVKTLEDAGVQDAYPANLNSPVQTVLSGTQAGLEKAGEVLKEAGARRVIPLKVSGPFHSPLMSEAKERFEQILSEVTFSDPTKPVYANVTGEAITSGEESRKLCADQLIFPVRWVDEETQVAAGGFDQLLEVGPGEVLTGLWKGYCKSHEEIATECIPAGTKEQIESLN